MSLTYLFQAPHPYLMGSLLESLDDPPYPENALVVNVDNNSINNLNLLSSKHFFELPEHIIWKLWNRITKHMNFYQYYHSNQQIKLPSKIYKFEEPVISQRFSFAESFSKMMSSSSESISKLVYFLLLTLEMPERDFLDSPSDSEDVSDNELYAPSAVWYDPEFKDTPCKSSEKFIPTLMKLPELEEPLDKKSSFDRSDSKLSSSRNSFSNFELHGKTSVQANAASKGKKINLALSNMQPPYFNLFSPQSSKCPINDNVSISSEPIENKHSHLNPVSWNKIGTSESPLHFPSDGSPHLFSPFSVDDSIIKKESNELSSARKLNLIHNLETEINVIPEFPSVNRSNRERTSNSPIKCLFHNDVLICDPNEPRINIFSLRKAFLSVSVSMLRGYRDFINIPKTIDSNADDNLDNPFSPLKKVSLRKSNRPEPIQNSNESFSDLKDADDNTIDKNVKLFDAANFVGNAEPVYHVLFFKFINLIF